MERYYDSIYLGPPTVTMYSTLFITPQSSYRDMDISVSYSARYTYAHTSSNTDSGYIVLLV